MRYALSNQIHRNSFRKVTQCACGATLSGGESYNDTAIQLRRYLHDAQAILEEPGALEKALNAEGGKVVGDTLSPLPKRRKDLGANLCYIATPICMRTFRFSYSAALPEVTRFDYVVCIVVSVGQVLSACTMAFYGSVRMCLTHKRVD